MQKSLSRWIAPLLIGSVILASILIGCLPVVKCSSCLGYKTNAVPHHAGGAKPGFGTIVLKTCYECRGRGRVAFPKRWLSTWQSSMAGESMVIGIADQNRVSPSQLMLVLQQAGIDGGPGPGSVVFQVVVPAGQVSAALDVLQMSKLLGLKLYLTVIGGDEVNQRDP